MGSFAHMLSSGLEYSACANGKNFYHGAADHIDRRYQRWASSVPNGFADRAPRNASKNGGKAEYVATETVLRWIYEHEGA